MLRTYVPRDVYERFSLELQLLYRHLVDDVKDVLQPGNQYSAAYAQSLRGSARNGDNGHIVVGAMSREEWERSRRAQSSV